MDNKEKIDAIYNSVASLPEEEVNSLLINLVHQARKRRKEKLMELLNEHDALKKEFDELDSAIDKLNYDVPRQCHQ